MHRRIKGLLSLALVFVMVTATVNPVLADELPQEPLTAETAEIPQEPEQPQTTVETGLRRNSPKHGRRSWKSSQRRKKRRQKPNSRLQ